MDASRVIRRERAGDSAAVRAVNLAAFEGSEEADIVDRVRQNGGTQLSLVAEIGSEVVGHILFSEVTVGDATGMGLAPMAVLPAHQGRGVGAALIEHGLDLLRATGLGFVIVLGHPGYYPRFGFVPASRYSISTEYGGVPDEVFMALELVVAGLEGVSGVARYRPEFGGGA